MSWADKVRDTARAALADRTATADRICADVPWSWKADDVWLTRVKQPRDLALRFSISEQSNPLLEDTAVRA